MITDSDIKPTEPDTASNAEPDDDEFVMGRGHGHKPRERKDIASGEVMDPAHMIRLAFSPDGDVVPDVFAKLPGRGAWVAANRESVEMAISSNAFARAAKRKVNVPAGFADLIEQMLERKVLGLISMANRAGELESGFDKVRSVAQADRVALRFEASDGSEDGRSKIRVIVKAIANELDVPPAPCIGCFNALQLGQVIGREHMVHLAVRKGRLARTLHAELSRLSGFREFVPDTWPDKEHEPEFIAFTDRRSLRAKARKEAQQRSEAAQSEATQEVDANG